MAWYDSNFGHFLGIGALALGVGIAYGIYNYTLSNSAPQVQQSADLNGNGKPERFYTIEDKVAVTEVDGEPIVKDISLSLSSQRQTGKYQSR